MIALLRGKILETFLEKDALRVLIDVQGVGYEVLMSRSTEGRIKEGQTSALLISESVTAFDGATTLYGFVSKEEKDFYNRLRENVDGMGPKKALECLDKISKSMPDFKRAIIDEDARLLVSVFGFTKRTAEKLIFALRGKAESWSVTGVSKWQEGPKNQAEFDALSGLLNLGCDEAEARDLLQKAKNQLPPKSSMETLLKEALRLLGTRIS